MSAAEQGGILSREELDALLETLREEGAESPLSFAAGSARAQVGYGALERCMEEFAEEQGRLLSTSHQTMIRWTILGSEEMRLADIADLMTEHDRAAMMGLGKDSVGYLLMGRAMVFALLSLTFGAPPGTASFPLPIRVYTRIEEILLRRAVGEVVQQLQRSLRGRFPIDLTVMRLEESDALRDGDENMHLTTIDVQGLGDLCRLRIALPADLFRTEDRVTLPIEPVGRGGIETALLDAPVTLVAEIGTAEVSISRLARLAVGDEILIEPSDAAGLLVRVEGRPKFRAVRGSVGPRAALQLVERV